MMELQLESLRQQLLHHPLYLATRLLRWKLLQLFDQRPIHLGLKVELCRIHPIRTAKDAPVTGV